MTANHNNQPESIHRTTILRAAERIKHDYRRYPVAMDDTAPEPEGHETGAGSMPPPKRFGTLRALAAAAVSPPMRTDQALVREIAREAATETIAERPGRVDEAHTREIARNAAIEAIAERLGRMDEARVREIAIEAAAKAMNERPGRVQIIRFPERPDVNLPEAAHKALPNLIAMVAARLHVFLVGPAGSGKSILAEQAAKALGLELSSLSLGPTTPTTKLFGYRDAHGAYVGTPFRRAYEQGGLMLIDEMDNGHPGLLAELNQALANGHAAFGDGMVERHEDFRLVATGNTYGLGPDRRYVGRNALDAATLDRFALLQVPIDQDLEKRLTLAQGAKPAIARRWLAHVRRIRAKVDTLGLNVIVSPRASIEGARLLAGGLDWDAVQEARLIGNFDSATRAKLLS